MKKFKTAIDFSTGTLLLFVLDDSGKTVIDSSLEIKGRDSSGITPWITQEFEKKSFKLSDIESWTCGMGPGSFTGLRIVSAIISGMTFNSSVKVRGIPSAIAIAAEVRENTPSAKTIGILYDGRRGEVLCYGIKSHKSGFSVPESTELPVITRDDYSTLQEFDVLAAMDTEKTALIKIISDPILKKILFLDSFPVRRLVDDYNFPWDRKSLLNPVYLRPPVHIQPNKIRENV